jgi:hypothetical protein
MRALGLQDAYLDSCTHVVPVFTVKRVPLDCTCGCVQWRLHLRVSLTDRFGQRRPSDSWLGGYVPAGARVYCETGAPGLHLRVLSVGDCTCM